MEQIQVDKAIQKSDKLSEGTHCHGDIFLERSQRAKALYELGKIAQQKGDFQLSEKHYLEALKLQSDFAEVWFNLGCLYHAKDRLLEAIEAYWNALGLRPNSASIFNNLGYALQQLERWEEAGLCYQEALNLQPNLMVAQVNLGNVLFALNRLEEARYLELAGLNYNLGIADYQRGNFSQAERCFQQTIALHDLPEAYAAMGMVFAQQAQQEAAIAHCQHALSLDSENAFAQACLKQISDLSLNESEGVSSELFDNPSSASISAPKLATSKPSKSQVQGTEIRAKSDLEILKKVSESLWNWAKTGLETVGEETFQKRYQSCMHCPHLVDAPPRRIYQMITANKSDEKACNLCGCIISKKARMVSETCPDSHPLKPGLNRWGEDVKH